MLSADVDVELDVVDRNNKPPVWDANVYGPIHIKENVTVGTVVTSVKARFVCHDMTETRHVTCRAVPYTAAPIPLFLFFFLFLSISSHSVRYRSPLSVISVISLLSVSSFWHSLFSHPLFAINTNTFTCRYVASRLYTSLSKSVHIVS